jgi:hypothetical protein
MPSLKEFQLEVVLHNGARLTTTFTQMLEDHQQPATRFYLGYSTDTALTQDLPWIAVGDIAYMPDEAVAVKIVPKEQAQETPVLRAL